jgi:NTP pyrophosphatase (non-canonical NTP hydrolase)
MKIDDYQDFTETTAIYPKDTALAYLALGLASETGEVCDKLKKHIRDSTEDELSRSQAIELAKELGDVLWYVARIAQELDMSLSQVILMNYNKLTSRKANNTIKGSGDNR